MPLEDQLSQLPIEEELELDLESRYNTVGQATRNITNQLKYLRKPYRF